MATMCVQSPTAFESAIVALTMHYTQASTQLSPSLYQELVRWPETERDRQAIREAFYRMARMPGLAGKCSVHSGYKGVCRRNEQ
ncbi:unnamed protein product [Sphagnum balticum]